MAHALQAAFAKIIGAALLIVGLVGYIWNPVLGLFSVNALSNIAHIVIGILGLAAGLAAAGQYAKTFNILFGFVFLLLAVLGFGDVTGVVTALNLNIPDNVVHILIAVLSLGIGFGAKD